MLLALTCAAGTVAAATLETNAQTPSRQTDSQLLEDFNHYVTIANIEMAKASAQALIDRGLPPATFVGIVEDSATIQERFERAYRRAILMPDLESVAARLYGLYEEGRLARARDPKEIDRNIALLTGMARGRLLAQQRLAFAGEYAVPQMLLVLQGRKDQLLSTEVSAQLAMMGRQSVQPLCAALLGVDPATQEMIARVLGRIAYPSALPYLAELHQTTTNPQVKAAAAKAIGQLGGSLGDSSVAGMYRDLAEQYYAEPKSLTSFPSEKYQLVWSYAPSTGLQPTAVRTEVFHEAMAMGLCERALRLDPTDQAAISLWLASNFSRETDQPAEYENPMYPASRRDAMYYAVAAGAEATQRVLARALADRDTPLARQAIEALSRSAGVSGLVGMDGSVPLVDALTYPERRVRFEAALALGRAKPREPFAGADRVVPTLAGVIREGAKRYAVVLASDLERQQALRKLLEGQGFVVLPPGSSLEAVSPSIADASGIDLVLADVTSAGTIELIEQARNNSRLQATPILGLMSASGYTQYAGQFEGDRLTQILRQGVSDAQLTEGIRQLVERAAGPVIDDEESKLYAAAALDVLHDVAIVSGGASAGASAFDINDAAVPLINALSEVKGDLRVQVADVLSYIGQERAQVALMDAVINSTGGERLVLMTKMNNSAKRFGNLLEARQVKWLVDLAEKGASEDATVAASLIGALNLPNERLVPLIVGPAR
ncbi:MAG: HEAT repeat domain-containing protein [Phycisphaerae bacterium]|nr:HEAT repeat domain-containing protein [Phycisphaerae bacterium]